MSDRRSGPRRAADDLLLAEGPKTRDELIAFMMPLFNHGKVASKVHRILDENGELNPRYAKNRKDDWEVGAGAAAREVIGNALSGIRKGQPSSAWIQDGDLIRHRDWVEPASWVPPTIDELSGAVAALGLSRWQWAAVIATYVVESDSRAHANFSMSHEMSASDFAALGFAALESKDTVRKYLRTWLEHSGGVRPEPGQPVVIPDIPWPTKRTRERDRTNKPAPKPQPKPRVKTDAEHLATSGDPVETAIIIMRMVPDRERLEAAIQEIQRRLIGEQMSIAKQSNDGVVVPLIRQAR